MNSTGRGRGRVMLAPAICRRYICVCELDYRARVWSLRFFLFFFAGSGADDSMWNCSCSSRELNAFLLKENKGVIFFSPFDLIEQCQ